PQHLRPVLDTEIQGKADEPVGAKMSTDNGMGVESGATDFRESGLKSFDQLIQDRANAQVAKMTPVSTATQQKPEAQQQPAEEKPKMTGGDVLAKQWLKRVMPPPPAAPEQQLGERKGPGLTPLALPPTEPAAQNTPAPAPEMHQETAGGPLAAGAPTSETPAEQRDLRNMERKARVEEIEKQRQEALRSGDLEKADKLAVAKAEMEKVPWHDRSLL